jgi:hypothetical protein
MTNKNTEEWKDIIGYKGRYQILDQGRVKSLRKNIIMSTHLLGNYKNVTLYNEQKIQSYRIHILVALHFIKNPQNKKKVDHIDHKKLNNKATNLRWGDTV